WSSDVCSSDLSYHTIRYQIRRGMRSGNHHFWVSTRHRPSTSSGTPLRQAQEPRPSRSRTDEFCVVSVTNEAVDHQPIPSPSSLQLPTTADCLLPTAWDETPSLPA